MTFVEFVQAIQSLTVAGVARHYEEPPESLSTADLPASFPMMPRGGRERAVTTCTANDKTRSIDFIVVIEAIGQGTQASRYDQIAALADATEAAIDAADLGIFPTYTINTGIVDVAGGSYLAITAAIETADR